MIVQTPIGRLACEATVNGRALSEPEALFSDKDFSPDLPPGMTVERAIAILVSLKPATLLHDVKVRCRWLDELPLAGDGSSGECLDAQSWIDRGKIVMVGTEDFDALQARMPHCEFLESDYPVDYQPQGFEVRIPTVPPDLATSLHFVVAMNSWPEPVECSSWYAVDVPHRILLALADGPSPTANPSAS